MIEVGISPPWPCAAPTAVKSAQRVRSYKGWLSVNLHNTTNRRNCCASSRAISGGPSCSLPEPSQARLGWARQGAGHSQILDAMRYGSMGEWMGIDGNVRCTSSVGANAPLLWMVIGYCIWIVLAVLARIVLMALTLGHLKRLSHING